MHNLYYFSYNSIISDGQRVRRMRRTQLSVQKVGYARNQDQYLTYRPFNKNKEKSNRSIPKLQSSNNFFRQKKLNGKSPHTNTLNQYFVGKPQVGASLTPCTLQQQFYRHPQPKPYPTHHRSQPRLQTHRIRQSSVRNLNLNEQKTYQEKSQLSQSSKKSFGSKIFNKSSKINQHKLKMKKQTSQLSSSELPQESSLKQSSMAQNVFGRGQLHIDIESKEPVNHYEKQFSKFQSKSKIKFIPQQSQLKSQISQIKFYGAQSQSQPQSQHQEDEEDEGTFSKLQSQGVSILKLASGSSSKKGQSLASVSVLKDKKSQLDKNQNPSLLKKMSLKLQSIKNEGINDAGKTSLRNLPLTSRQNSQRKSLAAENSKSRPMGDTLEEVLERLQIHDFIITLLSDFSQQTLQFHAGNQQRYERMRYLLERKHFLEKSNMIKALKGGKNVFNMSSIAIPTQILRKYLPSSEIKVIIEQLEETKKKQFKDLEKFFKEIKKNHKNDPFVKLQTPSDNFSKCLVNDLFEQLNELYPCVERLTGEKLEIYQDRIIEIIEKVFVLSEFAGRKVKKLQFAEQIEDFYAYYDQNYQAMMETIDFFQQMP